jgi:hypothetical protein
MSDTIILGFVPRSMDVRVTASDPFACKIHAADGTAWPAGVYQLEFVAATVVPPWVATATGPDLVWQIADTVVDAVIAAAPTRVRLTGNGVVWASGPLRVTSA